MSLRPNDVVKAFVYYVPNAETNQGKIVAVTLSPAHDSYPGCAYERITEQEANYFIGLGFNINDWYVDTTTSPSKLKKIARPTRFLYHHKDVWRRVGMNLPSPELLVRVNHQTGNVELHPLQWNIIYDIPGHPIGIYFSEGYERPADSGVDYGFEVFPKDFTTPETVIYHVYPGDIEHVVQVWTRSVVKSVIWDKVENP